MFGALALLASCGQQSQNSQPVPSSPSAVTPNAATSQTAAPGPANPTATNATSISQGAALYHKADCALCHGKLGDGKGFLARDVRMNVHDWRDAAYGSTFTDGQFYSVILKGKDKMPAYETRNTPEQIWLMVDYIRSLSAK